MVSWTWQAMSGNGAPIGMAVTIVEALGKTLKGMILVVNACCVGVHGVLRIILTCAVRIEIGSLPISRLTTQVFDAFAM